MYKFDLTVSLYHTHAHKHTSLRSSSTASSRGVPLMDLSMLSEHVCSVFFCVTGLVLAFRAALIPVTILHLMERTFKL